MTERDVPPGILTAIGELEKSRPGWIPMFYFTGSCDGDHAEAARLRAEYGLPPATLKEQDHDA